MAAPFWIEKASAYARDAAGSVAGASEARAPVSLIRDGVGAGLRAETLSVEQMEAHVEAWAALAERALEPNAFFEPGFALALARRRSGRAGPRFVAVWRDAERESLAGLFPLAPASALTPGLARIWLDEQTALGTPLVDRNCAHTAVRAFFAHLLKSERVAGVVFPRLTQSGATSRAILSAARETGREVETLCAFERAALYAGSDADALARRGASNHALRELYRRRRRLEERGAIEFALISEAGDIEGALEEFLALEASGWKGARGALLRQRNLASFARSATQRMARRGQCRIARLALDGRPLAMGILFTSGDRAYFWKIAFDERFRAFAPGIDLVHRLSGFLAGRDDLDHATFERNRSNADNVIDSKGVERAAREKPVPTFSHRALALTDSCAIVHHPMIDRFWPDRIGVCDIAVALDPARPRAFRAACAIERAKRSVRERIKRVVNRALRRKVS